MRITMSRFVGYSLMIWRHEDREFLLDAYGASDMSSQRPDGELSGCAIDAMIDSWQSAVESGQSYTLALSHSDQLVGCISAGSLNRRHGTAWMSYWTHSRFRERGHASAGLMMMSEWCFGELDLYRLELGHRCNNRASCQVALRAGYLAEGVEREKLRYGDERYDVELHARLRSDPSPN